MNLYRWLYSHIGGRMWTYILRDSWAEWEIVWIIGLLIVGATLGKYFGWIYLLERLMWLLGGYLLGHLFWGTAYRQHQR